VSYLARVGKRLMQQSAPYLYDQDLEIVVVSVGGRDKNGDPTTRTTTVVWEGKGALLPNLPRYERSAVAMPILGVEERRVVYYAYLPYDAPVRTAGMALRYNQQIYELVKDPLPIGGEQNQGGSPAGWRLDLGAPFAA
jgi:hypothetical protein